MMWKAIHIIVKRKIIGYKTAGLITHTKKIFRTLKEKIWVTILFYY